MSFKNFLTKVGLVEDDISIAKPKTAPTLPNAAVTTSSGVFTPTVAFSPPAPTVDPSIQEMLNQSLQDNKLSGFDYLKFISAVEESASTGVAEDARFKMTFSTAKQLGVDKAGLIKSCNHYVDVLASDERDFNADCAQYEKNQVQSREAKIESMQATIVDLTNQLTQLNQNRATLIQELQQEKTKLESRKAAFRVTLNSVSGTIKSNIDKINQYLQ